MSPTHLLGPPPHSTFEGEWRQCTLDLKQQLHLLAKTSYCRFNSYFKSSQLIILKRINLFKIISNFFYFKAAKEEMIHLVSAFSLSYFSRIMYWDDVLEFPTHSEWFPLWVTVVFFVTDDWLHRCLLAASVPHAASVFDGVFQNTVDNALTWQIYLSLRFCCRIAAADSSLTVNKWLSADIAAEILLYRHENFYLLCKV